MRNETTPSSTHTERQQQAALTAGGTERKPRAPCGSASSTPGLVIPGERLATAEIPDSGERHELVALGGKARIIAHPIPSENNPGDSAITDYLNCTFPFKTSHSSLSQLFTDLAEVIGAQFGNVTERGKGMNGYERSFDLGENGAKFCCVGQRDTGLLMLPGDACHTIRDWPVLIYLLRDDYGARITRWDGAVDDFEGIHSVDSAVAKYLNGDFTNSGNRPSCNQIGNWIEPDGSGRTFYVGKRQNGKMVRIYEKGMQCGVPFHPWVRWEVELHNVDRVVPWEVLLEPGKYVAGAYPKALGWLDVEASRIKTIKNASQLTYEHLVKCGSTAYGPLVNVMMGIEGSADKVIERLRKDRIPKRLQFPLVPDGVK
ncbi:MAG: replication initiation factor domain-containing protein [Georgfuchsia sp.]